MPQILYKAVYSCFLYLDGVLADSQGVPQLDGLVPRARDNLAIVLRESHAEDILGVSHKASRRLSSAMNQQLFHLFSFLKHTTRKIYSNQKIFCNDCSGLGVWIHNVQTGQRIKPEFTL